MPEIAKTRQPNIWPSYETVAASQTAQVLGTNGHRFDVIKRLIIVPATTSPGAVSIGDGDNADITVFAGGASSVADLTPIVIECDLRATDAGSPLGWDITTGANVSVIAVGYFS